MKRIGIISCYASASTQNQPSSNCSPEDIMKATGSNTGNTAFVHGIGLLFDNNMHSIHWDADPEELKATTDHIVICGANQLGSHTDLKPWAQRLEKFDLPVTIMGLGAQSPTTNSFPTLHDGTKSFLDAICKLSISKHTNIASRGTFTESFLKSMGIASCPSGCPSIFISLNRDLGQQILKTPSNAISGQIAVAAGNPWENRYSAKMESLLIRIVNETAGAYILQHPLDILKIRSGDYSDLRKNTEQLMSVMFDRKITLPDVSKWLMANSRIFADVPSWIDFISQYNAVIGTRYHGVLLGILAGIPGCIITIDSRTEELADSTGIKSIPISKAQKLSPEELIQTTQWSEEDAVLLDKQRNSNAQSYVALIEDNTLTPSAHLLKLAE